MEFTLESLLEIEADKSILTSHFLNLQNSDITDAEWTTEVQASIASLESLTFPALQEGGHDIYACIFACCMAYVRCKERNGRYGDMICEPAFNTCVTRCGGIIN
jgi:hypothetical protein